jgi:hypothetical protein
MGFQKKRKWRRKGKKFKAPLAYTSIHFNLGLKELPVRYSPIFPTAGKALPEKARPQ